MNEQELKNKIALMESVNDQLSSELAHVDELMRRIGFSEGLEAVKATAQDLYENKDWEEPFAEAE